MKIGVIGFGNLGKAFVSGLLKSGFNSDDICLTAKTEKTLNLARKMYPNLSVFSNKSDLVKFADILILCIEPYYLLDVCMELSNLTIENKIIVSFASKIEKKVIEQNLDSSKNKNIVFRAMPNISISICEGIIGIFIDEQERLKKEVLYLFSVFEKLGKLFFVNENELEKITVVASCGVSFANMLIYSYQSAVEKMINSKDVAKEITHQVFFGAMRVLENLKLSNEEFNKLVTTKGGATEKGLEFFDTESIKLIIQNVMNKSYEHISK